VYLVVLDDIFLDNSASGGLTRSTVTPWLLRTPAARLEIAPPRECPVATTLKEGYVLRADATAARTPSCASSHELQKPVAASQLEQMVVLRVGKFRFVIQLRTEREPRKEMTMSLFVVSVATKPVASVLREL
jgi:hypothetical protein